MTQSITLKRIVTHKRPDVDALVSVWLAERFLFPRQPIEVLFVDYGCDLERLPSIDCAVDLGGVYCKNRLIFDHKPPAFTDRHATCAAKLLWLFLHSRRRPVDHLADLVQLVHDGDSARLRSKSLAFKRSRANGLHAAVRRWKIERKSDDELYRRIRTLLNRRYQHVPIVGDT
jgi:hypothetical protein